MLNFRRIASILSSAVMVSSTIGLAAAANYPAPFVSGGAADVAIVYGSSAVVAQSDLAAAATIQSQLSTKLAEQTASGGTTSVSGEGVNLGTTSQKLYMNSSINAARVVLTKSELPTVLADGTATDLTGTSYDYTQSVALGDSQITFSKSGESIDPVPMVNVGTTSTDPLYNYTLTLTKTLNVSDTTNVVGQAELTMQGVTYTVGANSDYNTLYLYGSGVATSVDEGETKTVAIAGADHTVQLKGASATNTATIIVDGIQKSVTKGSSYKFAGDFEVYVKDIFYTAKTGTLSNIDLLLGANTLHLEDTQAVRKGADDTSVQRTKAWITGTAGVGISAITIAQAAASSTGDYIAEGGSYTDRVLGGIKFQFGGLHPELSDASRDSVVIDTDNSVAARVTFTSALAGASQKTITYARDPDGVSDSVLAKVLTANDNNKTIHLVENETVSQNDWVIINAGDYGRILELTAIGPGSSSTDKTTFTDVITNQNFDFTTGYANATSINIDGYTYYVFTHGGDTGTASLTWGSGAASGYPGDATTLFPRIKLKNGEWLSILSSTVVSNGTTYALPGVRLLSSYESGKRLETLNFTAIDNTIGYVFGNVNYTVKALANVTTLNGAIIGGSTVNFNTTRGPAVLVLERDTLADTNGNVIAVPLTTEGTTTVMPAISSPVLSDASSVSNSLETDNNINQGVDVFGTLIARDTTDNNKVTIAYPQDQMYADVLATELAATVSGTGGTATELGYVIVTDALVSSVSSKNLIVVGGSCINSVAAKLLGSDTPLCGADWEAKTGAGTGQYLIKTYASPYSSAKVATLVAGYNAGDTTAAATYLTTQTVAIDKTAAGVVGPK